MQFVPTDVLASFADRQLARGCGIVTVRQRPGTAKGVVFLTLEDEADTVNTICLPSIVDEYRREVMGAELLGLWCLAVRQRRAPPSGETHGRPQPLAW